MNDTERIEPSVISNETAPQNHGLSPDRLQRVTRFIDERIDQPLSPEILARHVGLSEYHFHRSFKRSTGMTPMRYVWALRVDHAKMVIATDREAPLVRVALASGFSNQSHFNAVFRRHVGMTPSEYRLRSDLHAKKRSCICRLCDGCDFSRPPTLLVSAASFGHVLDLLAVMVV